MEKNLKGIVISNTRYSEKNSVVGILSESCFYHKGWVDDYSFGLGQLIEVNWRSRLDYQLGKFNIEHVGTNLSSFFWNDSKKLQSLLSIFTLTTKLLPEKIYINGLFGEFLRTIELLSSDPDAAVISWEKYLNSVF